MPTISTFVGVAIRMFFADHPLAHFHVAYLAHADEGAWPFAPLRGLA
jgi:hypothetical protein